MRKQKLKTNINGRRISLYIRVSTEEQASNPEGSIKNQEERLRMTVKLKNMEGHFGDIVAVYVDRAKSGKDTNRPELQKLLLAIRKHETDLVMVSELSRISRSIKDFSDIWQMMKDNGCGFQSLRENFDTTTAAGEMVLFTVANIAQFERRQISERVSANFNVRAQRGLFNGGAIPFGYKRIQDKPGYLEIDEDGARSVRAAFKAYVIEGSLSHAAKWLNANGHRMKIEREGGGVRNRLGYFTTGNLKAIIKNKFYIGVKVFHDKGVIQEVESVWPGIIDIESFQKANLLLGSNHCRNKENMVARYPYILPGLIFCKCCGDRLVGKSAHGKREKIGYYEHALSTKRMATDPSLKRECFPYRTLAKVIEPLVWHELENLITEKSFAEELLKFAQRAHKLNPGSKEIEKHNQTIFSTDRQIEILAERLSMLPKEISPTPIFKQMEKLEGLKRLSQDTLNEMTKNGFFKDVPCDLKTFESFLDSLKIILKNNNSENMKFKARMIRALVDKVLVTQDGLEIYFKVGSSYVGNFLEENKKKPKGDSLGLDLLQNLGVSCSNTCKSGVPLVTIAGICYPHDLISIPGLTEQGIISEIVPKYESGHSLPEISRITGIPRTTVRDLLIRAGVSLRSTSQGNKAPEQRGSGQVRWNAPYGFKYERGRLVPHPQEFETLRFILKWSREEMSFEDISKKLNAQKLRPRSASSWTRFTVRQIIKWHQANPEVILKRDSKVVTYQPWESANSSESKTINKSKPKRSKRHGTR